jgi:hypothetical protein
MDDRIAKEGSSMGVALPPWWAEATLRINSSEYDDHDDYDRDYDAPAGDGLENLSGTALVAWIALQTRMRERGYPWLLRREEHGKPVVTVGVTGTSLRSAVHNLVNAIKETRAIMQIPNYDPKNPAHAERSNVNMRRRDRDNEHFVIFNSHKPYEMYRHSWYMPHDHKNVDVNIEKLGVVQEGETSSRVSAVD